MLLKENIIELHCCGRAWGARRRSNQEQKIRDKNFRDLLSFFCRLVFLANYTEREGSPFFGGPTGKQKSKWTKVTGCGVVIYERFYTHLARSSASTSHGMAPQVTKTE